MMKRDIYELKNVDPEDIDDLIPILDKSFDIKLTSNDFKSIKTFGDFCDAVIKRIDSVNLEDCTSQQAFYKLRNALGKTLNIDKDSIALATPMENLFHRKARLKMIRKLYQNIGFKFKVVQPKEWISFSLAVIFIVSLVTIFFKWKWGLCGLAIYFLIGKISDILGKEFVVETVGGVTKMITREHYSSSRRKPGTANNNEVVKTIQDLFIDKLGLDATVLHGNAVFNEPKKNYYTPETKY